jgi:hypothetical protein
MNLLKFFDASREDSGSYKTARPEPFGAGRSKFPPAQFA